ncbi:MAG: metal-dependent hydrolase [Actinomycetota bacterium]|nr:metal-dependent hydrolase [Actinomycetota bacterium]
MAELITDPPITDSALTDSPTTDATGTDAPGTDAPGTDATIDLTDGDAASTPRTISERKVPTRRISFEESLRTLPKHFAAGDDLILSHLAASLSAVFPDGEDFFVRSVRHYRSQITDPELKAQVAGFIGQEAMHGREHRAFNDRLAELGYPTKAVERFTQKGLAFREKVAPPISNLASTAALEHFTATLAELILTDDEAQRLFGDEAVKNLFLWHALEESEHKAVAFDVYRAVGGTERMRILTMKGIRYGFVIGMAVQVAISLARDEATYDKGRLRESWRTFRRSPLVSRKVWRELKKYDRKGFHPDDIDSSEVIRIWREELFGDDGSLNELLVGNSRTA